MVLETNRLILRRFVGEDWKDLYEYLSQENVVKYEPYGPLSAEVCKTEAVNRSSNEAFWAVCLKEENNKLIGNIYFERQEPFQWKTWELGYVFNPSYWGKGYATEACKRIMRYAFEQLEAHRIMGRCNPENASSWKLMERLSMRREGHFKKPAFFKMFSDGRPLWHDAFEYAILEEEWFALRTD